MSESETLDLLSFLPVYVKASDSGSYVNVYLEVEGRKEFQKIKGIPYLGFLVMGVLLYLESYILKATKLLHPVL